MSRPARRRRRPTQLERSRTESVQESRCADTVYVPSNAGFLEGGTIFALDMLDGSTRRRRQFPSPIMGGSMALAGDVLFRGTWDGTRHGGGLHPHTGTTAIVALGSTWR